MKICAVICEYNPFHNGHLYQLQETKRLTGADKILCVMSGNFTQRGEAAVLGKYLRARHAVAAGADAVIELPLPFAISNAEIFTGGGIKMLSALPCDFLSFGCESGDREDYWNAARIMNNEPKEISEKIKTLVSEGKSYAKAYTEAWQEKLDGKLLMSPNNLLGVNYTRALLSSESKTEIFPIPRQGSNHGEKVFREGISSATAIRKLLSDEKICETENLRSVVPDFVFSDLFRIALSNTLEVLEKYALIMREPKEISRVLDCTEGLENALKRAAEANSQNIVAELTSKRYTSSRIRRILLHNLLGLTGNFIRECLKEKLYFRVLAAKKGDEILKVLSENQEGYPVLIRAGDEKALTSTAKKCFDLSRRADLIYAVATGNIPEKRQVFSK